MNHKMIVANQHEVSIDGGHQQQNYPKSKSTKRDDGRPRKSLSAYNIFFKIERNRIIEEQANNVVVTSTSTRNKIRAGKHANVGFANLARIVADKWKNVDTATKLELMELARKDKERYEREKEEWLLTNEEENEETSKVLTESLIFSDKDSKDFMFNIDSTVESKKESLTKSDTIAPPFKFDKFDPSTGSIFCPPCSDNTFVHEPKQRSVVQPEKQNFLPGCYSDGSMNIASTHMQSCQSQHARRVSGDGVVGGDFAAPVIAFCMPCIPSPITVFGAQVFSMETNHQIVPTGVPYIPSPSSGFSAQMIPMDINRRIAIDRMRTDDVNVLRELYESRMRRNDSRTRNAME